MADDPDGLDAKNAYVDVYLDFHHEPPFYFETQDLKLDPPHHLYFKHGRKDGFRVHFTLRDETYVFASKKDEALYAHNQAKCPDGPCKWNGFNPLKVDGPTLTVHNLNDGETDFGYTLRITNDGGKSYKELDPIGTNQNSNSSGSSTGVWVAAGVFVAGAAIGAIAAKAAIPLATQSSVVAAAAVVGVLAVGVYLFSRGGVAKPA
jgi:hypothetical protein